MDIPLPISGVAGDSRAFINTVSSVLILLVLTLIACCEPITETHVPFEPFVTVSMPMPHTPVHAPVFRSVQA